MGHLEELLKYFRSRKPSKIYYMYLGDTSLARTNVITVAYYREGNKLRCGFAFSNKEDLYDKSYGRALADCRINEDTITIKNTGDIKESILNYLTGRKIGEVPSWTFKVISS